VFVCVCVCVCVCLYTYVSLCLYVCINIYIYTHICIGGTKSLADSAQQRRRKYLAICGSRGELPGGSFKKKYLHNKKKKKSE
jgi:hypothetical protein